MSNSNYSIVNTLFESKKYSDKEVEKLCITCIAEQLGISENDVIKNKHKKIIDLNIDSLDKAEIIMSIEEIFDLVIDDKKFFKKDMTVSGFIEMIKQMVRSSK